MSIGIPGGPRQGGAADPSTLFPPRGEQPDPKSGAGGEGTDANAVTPNAPEGGEGAETGGKETGGSPSDAVGGDRGPGQTDPLHGGGNGGNGWNHGNGWPHGDGGPHGDDGPRGGGRDGDGPRGNGWGNGNGNGWGNQGRGGGDGLISGTLNQTGQLVSGLGSLIFGGRNQPVVNTPRTPQDSPFDTGGRNGSPTPTGGDPGRVVDTGARAPGETTPRTTQPPGTPGRTDSAPVARGNTEPAATTVPNGAQQPGASGRPAGAEARNAPQAGNAAATPQAMQQSAQTGVLTAGLSAAAQQALLGGLAANQTTTLPQQATQPQNAQPQQQNALHDAQARQAAGLPLTAEQRSLLQGALLSNPAANAQTHDKTLSAPPQQMPAGDNELRNPQQLPADAKRQAEAMDRSLAKQTAEQQQTRTANDPRANEAQVRADARALRDGADAKTRANLTDARQNVGENAKQNSQLANAERRPAGATESLRQAMDWVGQQVRGVGANARTDEEGVTAMRVVAGLVVAAVVVGVAIAVLYALRVAFVP